MADPRDLVEAVADAGEPITPDTVLGALWEAEYWHPGFRREEYDAAEAFDHWSDEQLPETCTPRSPTSPASRVTTSPSSSPTRGSTGTVRHLGSA